MTTQIRRGWRKSSFSNNGGASCVEVNFIGDHVLLRDSKYLRNPDNDPTTQPQISIPADLWTVFCDHSTDPTTQATAGMPTIDRRNDGWITVSCRDTGVTLVFTPGEWAAFIAGIQAEEFSLVVA
ncbi:DUF397 domain-containing protein [Nocardia speluncae]|uniref:DUF397 domain-containing protein n=1 Tax=Nocardia speluncae TaxID=419477 RepID=A0A846XJ87_9NOCA|nr:DUF397 domain-containing protein [Nocardia speluncae]NKY33874.1 DUF397 domain-containing protein [Nocardia speluncae]